ncbi:MAG: LysR family transcriptional regulator [Lentilitoribacter sp.]
MRQPTLKQIQAFKAFVETGTVVKAADLLFVSQPAVSKLLTHLEEDTGLHLLDRGHGKMNITERGMRLYEEIDRIFSGVDQISQAIETIRQEDRGHLNIGVMPAIPSRLLAQVTKRFTESYPDVYLSMEIRSSEFIVDGVLARKFDFGIVLKPLTHDQFSMTVLDETPFIAIVPPDHKFACKTSLTYKDLCDEPFISFAEGSLSRHVLDKTIQAKKMELNTILEASTANTILEMVAAGIGISVLHPISISSDLHGVKIIPLREQLSLPVHVVRAVKSRRDKIIDAFLGLLKEELENMKPYKK